MLKEPYVGEVTVREIENAEILLIKNEQLKLRNSEKFKSVQRSLNLFNR